MTAPTTFTVTGTYLTATGAAATGRVQFTPVDDRFVNNQNIVVRETTSVELVNGALSATLVSSVAGYTVVEFIDDDGTKNTFTIPGGPGSIDLRNYDTLLPEPTTDLLFNLALYCTLDGVTDDSTGFAAAIAALTVAGTGVLYHPGGTLLVGAAAQPTLGAPLDGVTLRGIGPASIIKLVPNTLNRNGVLVGAAQNVLIEHITFDGSASAWTVAAPAIQYQYYSGVRIDPGAAGVVIAGCVFRNFWAAGVMAGDGDVQKVTVKDCQFSDILDNQVFIRPGCKHVKIVGNTIGPTKTFATSTITSGGGSFSTASNFTVTVVNGTNFPPSGLGHVVITNTLGDEQDCAIITHTGNNLTLYGGRGSFLNGATVEARGYSGIGVIRSDDVTIDNNTVFDCAPGNADAGGITVVGVYDCAITNNRLTGNHISGIHLDFTNEGIGSGVLEDNPVNRACQRVVVADNTIRCVKTPGNSGALINNTLIGDIHDNIITGGDLGIVIGGAPSVNGCANLKVHDNEVADTLTVGIQAASVPATTVALASNGQVLGGSGFSITVASASLYTGSGVSSTAGTLGIRLASGTITQVTYTGISTNTFTGCSGGSGTLTTADVVYDDGWYAGPVLLEGNLLTRCGSQGIYVRQGTVPFVKLRRNHFEHCSYLNFTASLAIDGGCPNPVNPMQVEKNWFKYCQANHIEISAVRSAVDIIHNEFDTSDNWAIFEISSASGPSRIIGNTFRNIANPALWVLANAASFAKDNDIPQAGAVLDHNSSTATISDAATTVVVTHGLYKAPPVGLIDVVLQANLGAWWITNITSTQFTVNVATAAAAGNGGIGWSARAA